jgi:sarcosine oxidase
MRVIIAGLGAVGSMAAYHLARAGIEVIGLEQFRLGHNSGSSHGESRIVRSVYPDGLYTSLMESAFALWEQFEADTKFVANIADETRERLLSRCGGIFLGSAGSEALKSAELALKAARSPFEMLDADQLRKRYPAFGVQDHEVAIFDPGMGYARPTEIVRAASALARKYGADLRYNCPVIGWEAKSESVSVTAATGDTVTGDHLLVICGGWTRQLLEQHCSVRLPLTVTRQVYAHFMPSGQDVQNDFAKDKYPVWIDADSNMYGFPQISARMGVKLASHNPGAVANPDTVAREVTSADTEPLSDCVRHRFPGLLTDPSEAGVCLYTSTPSEDFIVDTLPESACVHVVSACSGHGFKFAPLTGAMAASLITGVEIPEGLEIPNRFRLHSHARTD